MEDRQEREDVRQVLGAVVGIVEHDHVAGLPLGGRQVARQHGLSAGPMVLRCAGMREPWAMMRPRASKSAVEKSRMSRISVEYAVRSIVVAICSQMASSALRTISTVNGSTVALAMRAPDDEGAGRVHVGGLAGKQHRRRVHLLDDGRTREAIAGQEPRAVVDRAVHPAAGLFEVDRARAQARGGRRLRAAAGQPRRRGAGSVPSAVTRSATSSTTDSGKLCA